MHSADCCERMSATINPYSPRASAKMRMRIMPTNSFSVVWRFWA